MTNRLVVENTKSELESGIGFTLLGILSSEIRRGRAPVVSSSSSSSSSPIPSSSSSVSPSSVLHTASSYSYTGNVGKGKGKVNVDLNTPVRRSGMARVLKGSHSFTCTPRVHSLTEWTMPAFASQSKLVLIYRPRRDGRLSWPWVVGWLHTEINVRHRELNPATVAHLSTNRARRRLTSLIEANRLTTRAKIDGTILPYESLPGCSSPLHSEA